LLTGRKRTVVSGNDQTSRRRPSKLRSWKCIARRWGQEEMMLTTILVLLGILWLLGFSLNIGGGLIHMLLVVALVILVLNVLSGRRLA
jgi:Family of unknown function (DUF5670)